MAQHAHLPAFGDWNAAENTSITQLFEREKANISNHNNPKKFSEISLKAGSLATSSKTVPNPEEKKDARLAQKDNSNVGRIATHARHEGVVRKHLTNPPHQQVDQANSGENQKIPNRTDGGVQPPLQAAFPGKASGKGVTNLDKRLPSQQASERRRNPGDRSNGTPGRDVVVPPFPRPDEMDPSSGEKYTGIFSLIAERTPSRNPGTPYRLSQPNSPKQDSTGTKASGCLGSLSGCFSGK